MVWASSQSQEHLAHQGRGGQPRLPVAWVSLARASLEPHTRLPVEGLARAGMRGYQETPPEDGALEPTSVAGSRCLPVCCSSRCHWGSLLVPVTLGTSDLYGQLKAMTESDSR